MSTTTPLTREDVVQRVREYFSREDAEFGYDGFLCQYRGHGDAESPIRCAVGCLIPDELYNPAWDVSGGQTVHHIWDEIKELFAEDVTPQFLSELQSFHDNAAGATTVEQFLKNIGERWPTNGS